ncbi:MAG TPA: phasin family protein [Accumulibacter sp.]|nr:phasin family protein [Accumulibacter sp.]
MFSLITNTFEENIMGKKLKDLAGENSESHLGDTIKQSAREIWLAGLGAFAKAQEEGGKVFDALVKEGATLQGKTRKATGETFAQVAGKASGTWDRLEQVFENRVARALGSLGVPTRQDIDTLSQRVADLHAAVQSLTEPQPASAAASKRPSKAAAAKPATEDSTAEDKEGEKPAAKPATARAPRKTAAKPITPADVLKTLPQDPE